MHSVAESLVAFTAAAALLTITPGLDTALVLRTVASEGPRRGLWSGIGIITGCLVWAASVAAGLGVLLVASRIGYTVLRWAGAGYLLYVGLKMLRHPRTSFASPGGIPPRGRSAFARGALTNLLNPKVGVFYVSFLPQFIPTDVAVAPFAMLLGAIHALLGLLWFACLIAAMGPLSRWLRNPKVVRVLDRITGVVFIAFGARLALESRGR
ncbi:MAG TPA: LysE family translocator [Steroidobacteraceae bacterium]|nr:LysE family translocator [Steroidobacteraceae bacterium]